MEGSSNRNQRSIANMKGGDKEGYNVPFFDDGGVLTKKYLHSLEDAVRARTVLPGSGISVIRTGAGTNISFTNATTCQILEFNVCSNGVPDKIAVLAVVTKPGYEAYDFNLPISYSPIVGVP